MHDKGKHKHMYIDIIQVHISLHGKHNFENIKATCFIYFQTRMDKRKEEKSCIVSR
jgi:hypothetical protein